LFRFGLPHAGRAELCREITQASAVWCCWCCCSANQIPAKPAVHGKRRGDGRRSWYGRSGCCCWLMDSDYSGDSVSSFHFASLAEAPTGARMRKPAAPDVEVAAGGGAKEEGISGGERQGTWCGRRWKVWRQAGGAEVMTPPGPPDFLRCSSRLRAGGRFLEKAEGAQLLAAWPGV